MGDEFYGTESTVQQKSKINSAGLINIRIHNLWENCHDLSRKSNYRAWNVALDRIWMELAGDVNPENEDGKAHIEEYKRLSLNVAKWFNEEVFVREGFNLPPAKSKISIANLYNALMEKEILLRRIFNEQGKGTAYVSEDEDDFD